eukprot:TRINITY_DN11291_c0_g1_i6.p1 TRINITY_DN11291_c0_g1~~TRINITY_DN11291_c0_g1_i6.p1  ORF type:complete len:150 (+),score=29.70 TRINITY_DN11291_c0_g1_i6:143-592(+)
MEISEDGILHEHWNIDFDDLQIVSELDQGYYGTLYKGLYYGTDVTIKKLEIGNMKEMRAYLAREISVLQRARHPNIVQFMGTSTHSSGVYIVTEYVAGGTLRSMLEQENLDLIWSQRVRMLTDICKAMNFLHSMKILHRDLTSANVMVC